MEILDIRNKTSKEVEKMLKKSAESISKGNLVVFPTETVYGIGANCFNVKAIKNIFLVKKRPYNDPLIVHISSVKQLKEVVKEIPNTAKKIIEYFWPGAVSIILKKNKNLPDIVTSNLDTVCVRMPNNKIALRLISLSGTPIAAPSANLFSRVSSTDFEHVVEDFSGSKEIEYFIYSGPSKLGVESTIIDCTVYPINVLRYGAVSVDAIKRKINLEISEPENIAIGKKLAPGQFIKHYSPVKKTFVVKNLIKYLSDKKTEKISEFSIVCSYNTMKKIREEFDCNVELINYGNNLQEIARNLYNCLRIADRADTKMILIEYIKPVGLGKTLLDRIMKASSNNCL